LEKWAERFFVSQYSSSAKALEEFFRMGCRRTSKEGEPTELGKMVRDSEGWEVEVNSPRLKAWACEG